MIDDNTPVVKKRGRKPKGLSLDTLKKETMKGNEETKSPVSSGPVLIMKKGGEEVARINPNSLGVFAKEHNLDVRALEHLINRPYCNHNGFTVTKGE